MALAAYSAMHAVVLVQIVMAVKAQGFSACFSVSIGLVMCRDIIL